VRPPEGRANVYTPLVHGPRFLTGNAKRAEELPADLWRAKGNPRPEGIVRQFAEEKSATPGQVALACNRSINSRSEIAWLREADITSPRR
jgi:hypothetical protein